MDQTEFDLSAQITDDGEPVEGVEIEFSGIGYDGGIVVDNATSGPDGVATLRTRGRLFRGDRTADLRWTTYRARVFVIQQGDAATATICAEVAEATFSYQP